MKRRTFIGTMTVAAVALNTVDLLAADAAPAPDGHFDYLLKNSVVVEPPAHVNAQFGELLDWMKKYGWLNYIRQLTGIDLDIDAAGRKALLARELKDLQDHPKLADFGGQRLIEPGFPEYSLLYHLLASPRVKPPVSKYPETEQLDVLENYIFGSREYHIPEEELSRDYVVAVFAYEYRPAFKMPDTAPYAGFTYSRTGIARIGDKNMNYDPVSRSYTNKPAEEAMTKHIAVSPARYGVFLAKKVRFRDTNLYTNEKYDHHGWPAKHDRYFLQPVQKIFNGDRLTGGTLLFAESHRNEKLFRLSNFDHLKPEGFDTSRTPFVKVSATDWNGQRYQPLHTTDLVNLSKMGSSVLLSSVPASLVRTAMQDNKIVSFNVPAGTHSINDPKSNRRYTSLKLLELPGKDMWDYIKTEGLYKRYKGTRFSAPRNAPLFANIRHLVKENTATHLGPEIDKFDEIVFNGGYATAMFEDNICDGCVSVKITPGADVSETLRPKLANCLPAFSLVSAPDFFPLSESYDLARFDDRQTNSFLEGGIENLSYCRLPVNPAIVNPFNGSAAFVYPPKLAAASEFPAKDVPTAFDERLAFDVSDTMVAILSGFRPPVNCNYKGKAYDYKDQEMRDYQSNTFMTDSAAFVLAPGWDVTYSGMLKDDDPDYPIKFLATYGLGAPFPEDMKLCAAANGMWPVASPDAARTFMGSLAPVRINIKDSQITPTAIPLLDVEIGIHELHPGLADLDKTIEIGTGWDGEQGPCLEKHEGEFWINFTDISRSDYVWNLSDAGPGFDMSRLRDLTCTELIRRMDALRLCKAKTEPNDPKFSHYWLISAECVADWNKAPAIGIPADLVGGNKDWARMGRKDIKGPGYLYLLAETIYDKKEDAPNWDKTHYKRRRLPFTKLIVCQIAGVDKLAWCEIPRSGLTSANLITWHDPAS